MFVWWGWPTAGIAGAQSNPAAVADSARELLLRPELALLHPCHRWAHAPPPPTDARTHTHSHTDTLTRTHTHTHTHTLTRTHVHTRTHTHTHTRTNTHTHIHARRPARSIRHDAVAAALWAAVALRRHREAASLSLRLLALVREATPRALVRVAEVALAFVSAAEATAAEGGPDALAPAEFALTALTAAYGEECPLTGLARAAVVRLRRAAGAGGRSGGR